MNVVPVSSEQELELLLHAIADPTRRAILAALAGGDQRVTAIAEPFAISLNSVSKHIQTLERAGLVVRRREGREHVLSLRPDRLDAITGWVEQTRNAWSLRLTAMDTLLTELSETSTRQEHAP
jgi:DNA-binding transcriptional ArsR family regulator